MFDYAFENFKSLQLTEKGHGYGCVPVKGGEVSEVAIVAKEDLSALVNKDVSVAVTVTAPEAKAPVSRGQTMGKVTFCENGTVIGEAELIAAESVDKEENLNFFLRIINWIMGK